MYGRLCTAILVIGFFFASIAWQPVCSAAQQVVDQEITAYIQKLFANRAQYLLSQNDDVLRNFYLPERSSSMRAMKHEQLRAKYVQAWAEHRGVRFVEAGSNAKVVRINKRGDNVFISAVDSLRLAYSYKGSSNTIEQFGIGTRHALTLTRNNGNWHVLREWYLDPLEENPKLIPSLSKNIPRTVSRQNHSSKDITPSSSAKSTKRYNRINAVHYANTYAGLAWGAGNNNRYNKKYRDYTGLGGDCTNFASQCLGDKEGGGLKMKGGWHHYRSGGSRLWVQTDAFKSFLLYSGYGKLIKRGTFSDITEASNKHPQGAWAELQPGDLIGHELDGDVDHFSIVVGFDANGYPLVNSHTADRYRVPFDLGWDQYTVYWLIHIRD